MTCQIPEHLRYFPWYAPHLAWLGYDLPGVEKVRADLRGPIICGTLETGVDLAYTNLSGANLSDANLTCANLVGAKLSRADLRGADLTYADLTGADFSVADFHDANLTCARLTRVNLTGANLAYADLTGADLRDANLTGARLTGARLTGADLTGAKFDRPANAPSPLVLRRRVAKAIRKHPELHDQGRWGCGNPNDCDTPCCVAGWACRLGGGTCGLTVPTAATLLLWHDRLPMPSFGAHASRDEILAALEARLKPETKKK